MKKLIILIMVLASAFVVQAQDAGNIINALKSGNAEQVADNFDKFIDLKFPDKDEIKAIGKNQGGIALKSFFNENNITGFELSSQREMGGTMYIAGKLTNDGDGNKISIMLKNKDGKMQIITVRIN
jgi:hypothetical protein